MPLKAFFGISRIAAVESMDKLCCEAINDAGIEEVLPGM